jgi:hypothetical protein
MASVDEPAQGMILLQGLKTKGVQTLTPPAQGCADSALHCRMNRRGWRMENVQNTNMPYLLIADYVSLG